MVSDEDRCKVAVFVKDTYRYTGRGKGGFEMRYTKRQCSRRAIKDGCCKIHQGHFKSY